MQQKSISTCGPIHGSIRPPSSKSITNRALICAALADGRSQLVRPLRSDDTHVMVDSLKRLGFEIVESAGLIEIEGQGGKIPADHAEIFIGNSGTSVRFLTAMVSLGTGTYVLDGVERMRQRPIQDLVDALCEVGVQIESVDGTGCPPIRVDAHGLRGGTIRVKGDVSSQFLSGLLMAAPYAQALTTIEVDGPLVSKPYVEMTAEVMRAFDVQVESLGESFRVPCAKYRARRYEIEPDASAASYFWAAAAISGGQVTVQNLSRKSLQGDVGFCDVLVEMGCQLIEEEQSMTIRRAGKLHGIDCDMNAISDTVQTIAAVALFADGPTTIRGIAHNRHKETDRIGNLAIELRKFGADVDEFEDGFTLHPPQEVRPAVINTYEDHRMAMSLALPGLRVAGVVINDPACTSKTYPEFFVDLERISQS